MNRILRVFFLVAAVCVCVLLSCETGRQTSSLDLRDRVKKIVLDNGMTVLMLTRQGAPVFSAQIKVRVGNVEEEEGSYGLGHFFEHMAFKGTETIGSLDFTKEQEILNKVLEIGAEIAKLHREGAPQKDVEALVRQRRELEEEQKKYIVKNEFTEILQSNGAVGLNASTSNDFTTYYVSLPVNKLELWAYMESERLKNPVLREFFTEVDVVAEERRMRIDNAPDGRLYEAFVNAAFDKSPYKVVVIGPLKEILDYTPQAAREFYRKYYVPQRMVAALVGNFDLEKAESIVRRYFGSLPKKSDGGTAVPQEAFDPRTFPREAVIKGPDRPRFYVGYHRPAHPHEDDIVFDVIQNLLCEGRTSRLYKKLVIQNKKAAFVGCYVSIPGARLDSLFSFYAMPLEGHTNREIKVDIFYEVQELASEGPAESELKKVINNIDAELIYSLQSNRGLAGQLAFYESLTGDWEYLYHLQQRIHEMTAEDVKRVATKYFVRENEVAAYLEQE